VTGARYEYGNARVRALRAGVLSPRALEALLERDEAGLLRALLATPLRPEVEAAAARLPLERRLDAALRDHLARTCRLVRGFYEGEARLAVEHALAARDEEDLLAVLRGQVRHASAEEILAATVGAGGLDEAALRTLAREPGARAAIDRIVAWDLPFRDVGRALLAAWPASSGGADLAPLERALLGAFAARAEAFLAPRPALEPSLGRDLRGAIDRRNILAALQVREARSRGEETAPPSVLPGGRIARGALVRGTLALGRDEAARAIAASPGGAGLARTLSRWVESGDPVLLSRDLERLAAREAAALLLHGDPLSVAVPLGFIRAKEAEARALRLAGRAAQGSLSREEARLEMAAALGLEEEEAPWAAS
jgi:vacuolar-type H+-ATPase subunit C/Vma6